MNFYRRFPGDYARDTKHLSMLEHGAYVLLLDAIYSTEKPLPKDETLLFRICSAYTKREKEAVRRVLHEFFYEKPTGFSNNKFEKELAHAESRVNAARENGKLGGRRPKQEPTGLANVNSEKSSPDSRLQTPSVLRSFDHEERSAAAATIKRADGGSTSEPENLKDPWQAIGADFPFGHTKFRDQWLTWFKLGESQNSPISQRMERCVTHCQDRSIGVPKEFYEHKRSIEAIEAREKSSLTETNHEKARRLERKAGVK
jgi:uncharacterized protein YdaU (DUF1376 family)